MQIFVLILMNQSLPSESLEMPLGEVCSSCLGGGDGKQNGLPVAPHSKEPSKKHEQESHVAAPHDDVHGVEAQDSPGNRGRRGLGLGAADGRAVLAAARPRDLVHRLVTALGGVVHGLHPMGREICGKECVESLH